MGLDTTSYRNITALPEDWQPPKTGEGPDLDELWEQGILRAGTYDCFPRAMDGLPGGRDPDPETRGCLGSRWYQLTEPGPRTRSSYRGHSHYRMLLKQQFWTVKQHAIPDDRQPLGVPFIDLIWFADNEGLLGPEACARLAVDYANHPVLDDGEFSYYSPLHEAWGAAVAHAAGRGAIQYGMAGRGES